MASAIVRAAGVEYHHPGADAATMPKSRHGTVRQR
jgi:hypothetical protein